MSEWRQQVGVLRVTTLGAALVAVFGGPAQAEPVPAQWAHSFTSGLDNELANLVIEPPSVIQNGVLSWSDTQQVRVRLNDVDVITSEPNGHAVQAFGALAELYLINGSSVATTGSGGVGIQSKQGAGVVAHEVNVSTKGESGFGVEADTAGAIQLIGGGVHTEGENAAGVRAISGVYVLDQPGTATLNGTIIGTTGKNATGLAAGDSITGHSESGPGSAGHIIAGNVIVIAEGEGAAAGRAMHGGRLTVTSQPLPGSGFPKPTEEAISDAAKSKLSVDQHARIHGTLTQDDTTAVHSLLFSAQYHGVLAKTKGHATIDGAIVVTTGDNAEGLRSQNDGIQGNQHSTGSIIEAGNAYVLTFGEASHGVTAYGSSYEAGQWNSGSRLTFSGGAIFTQGDEAAGARAANGGLITLNDTIVSTSGEGANGVMAFTDTFANPQYHYYTPSVVRLNNAQVVVDGVAANGLVAFNGDSLIEMNGGLVVVQDVDGSALMLLNDADIEVNKAQIVSAGKSIHSVFAYDDDVTFLRDSFEQTLEVRGTNLQSNNGTLMRVDRRAGGENGEITLKLLEGTIATGNIENYDAGNTLAGPCVPGSCKTVVVSDDSSAWFGIMVDTATTQANGGDTLTGHLPGGVMASNAFPVSFHDVSSINGGVLAASGSLFMFTGAPTLVNGNLVATSALPGDFPSIINFANDVQIQGDANSRRGAFIFEGNATITGAMYGDQSLFAFNSGANIGSIYLSESLFIGGGGINDPANVGGNVTVINSALTGNLNVGGSASGTNSILSPGNSIGRHAYGSLGAFSGFYVAEVNAARQSDLITIANGNADLKNTTLIVSQENGNGGYRLNHDYTILTTEKPDGISAVPDNRFAGEILDGSFDGTLVTLDPVKYGSNHVRIRLSLDRAADDRTGYTFNQNAAMDMAVSVAGQNPVADTVVFMQPGERKDALNQLSGELHGSTQAALLQNSSLVSRTLIQRMRANLGAGMLPGAPVAQAGAAVPAGAMPPSAGHPLWAQVVGNWSTLNDDGNAAKVTSDTAGLFVGGDTGVGGGWRVGGSLGYTDGRVKVNERSSRSDVSSFTAALYGGNSWQQGGGKLNLLA
ncbi:MAG TPA: autotransporter domain-containing protein, partial [Pusillimonas sp.]|uniref:autotransporter outer membrane beta-barrel domain-containing protein n=1 Tax=Pusillimonas sp. TaxID=3040095 RepID=UPI002BBA2A16